MSEWCPQTQHKFCILTPRPRQRDVHFTGYPHCHQHASLLAQLTALVKPYYYQRFSGVHLSPNPSDNWGNVLWNLVNTSSSLHSQIPCRWWRAPHLQTDLSGHCHLKPSLLWHSHWLPTSWSQLRFPHSSPFSAPRYLLKTLPLGLTTS